MKIKTLDRLETHDRLLSFGKQADSIAQGCQDCIDNRPKEFGNFPFYIFAHCRTDDDGYTKRLIWSPRLTKPTPQTNSILLKCTPPDVIRVIWMIPVRELWDSFKPGQMTHTPEIWKWINLFERQRSELTKEEVDDLSIDQIANIYEEMSRSKKYDVLMTNLYPNKLDEEIS